MIYHLQIALNNVTPAITRTVVVEDDMTLFELHLVVQIAMGWENCHLWQFEIATRIFADLEIDEYIQADDSRRILLREILPNQIGFEFEYTYDFGDDWEHNIRIDKIQQSDFGRRYPYCLLGENACPPEDCGGAPGYENILFLLQHPKHPQYEARIVEWLGTDFDPTNFDMTEVNDRLDILDQIRDLM
jgi:hypothetical protein